MPDDEMRVPYEELLGKYQVAMEEAIGEMHQSTYKSETRFNLLYDELDWLSRAYLGGGWCKECQGAISQRV